MKNENYDGDDARDCPFCDTPFSANTDTCLGSALDSIASLTARLAASEAAFESMRNEREGCRRLNWQLNEQLAAAREDAVRGFAEWLGEIGHPIVLDETIDLYIASLAGKEPSE